MRDLMRPIWDEPRPTPPPPGRVWRDWLLVAVVTAAVLTEAVLTPANPVFTLVAVPTLLWRRTRPLLMVVIAFGLCAALPGPDFNAEVFMVVLPYALFRWGSGREILAGSAVLAGRLGFGLAFGQITATELAAGLIVLFGAGALGLAMRYRARARLRDVQQIQLLERERLARDLHDTVAHHVSAMAIRAQAGLATAGTDPDSAVQALRLIETEASRALTEMRTLVRMLREEPMGLPEMNGLSGPPVDVQVSGDIDDLPPRVATTLYRLTQESVTNARRHARNATRITVRVTADDTAVRLRVSDDGAPGTPATGYGLTGMIERAGLLGGTCSAGPDAERGWTVDAVLPRTAV
ncbi:sensor histidine kinase [Actinoplanes aureus]|uniref:histidine kinase n=1 Tax=Actinoplanes aureus TaxID=2792083 RepID=A0A931FYZ4_9ACTN|nr:histidine kinase [Actinoplanes aureus]MBG0565123.1 sensor histidine kinase [Actinoplanes aureus]